MPFMDQQGELIGVIGIEITLNYLAKFFPNAELQPQDSLGYMIATSNDNGKNVIPIIMSGALQKRMIKSDQALVLSPMDQDKNIYMIKNHNSTEDLYASVEMEEKSQIRRERDYDGLTSILSHKGFQTEYEKIRLENSNNISALLMLDLDNLKHVNDTYGHKWGDQYLITAVEKLKEIAPKNKHLLGRRSGDEFVILLYGFETKHEIRQCLVNFYQLLLANPIEFPDGKIMPVTISAGVEWIDSQPLSYVRLLHAADEALYKAKRNRKGYFVENKN